MWNGPKRGTAAVPLVPCLRQWLFYIYFINHKQTNSIFCYTRCITPKRKMSWQGSLRVIAPWQHNYLLLKKYHSGGEPLAVLRKKLCCPAHWRGDGLHQLVTRFGVLQRLNKRFDMKGAWFEVTQDVKPFFYSVIHLHIWTPYDVFVMEKNQRVF